MTIYNYNSPKTWTPNNLNIPRVNWTAERAKSYRLGGGCKQSDGLKGANQTSIIKS